MGVAVDFVQTGSKNAHTFLVLELQQHCAQDASEIRMKALTKSLRQKRKESVSGGGDLGGMWWYSNGSFERKADKKVASPPASPYKGTSFFKPWRQHTISSTQSTTSRSLPQALPINLAPPCLPEALTASRAVFTKRLNVWSTHKHNLALPGRASDLLGV